jgi:tetratricopeptide (TPR) repeat protein
MSLLLEALKKAEKAKEEAQRRTSGEQRASAPLQLEEEAAPQHVLTRNELPDISPSLEILSDDIAPKEPAAASERRTQAGTPFAAQARPQAAREAAGEADRAAARKVFEVKFKEPNPRLPFFLTMGALGFAALCTGVYFWYQLSPSQPLVNASPPASGALAAAAAPGASSAASPPPSAPTPSAPLAQPPIPGLPGSSGSSATPAVPRAPVQPPLAAAPQTLSAPGPRETPAARPETSLRPAAPSNRAATLPREPEPAAARAVPRVHPKVESAYSAYVAGNISGARADYEDALRDDPGNRDALLGLAAVDVRSGRLEAAEATYLRLLRMDPRDAYAQAGLIALRGGRMDPLLAESRLKTLLATDPGAHVLNFALGNQLAQQGRWAEAQQQYFKAFAADPENADFAYNLAVSLDHLRQPKLALEYYQRALALVAKRGASFDAAAARARIAQLGN